MPPPKRCPFPNPCNLCIGEFTRQRGLANVIKLKTLIGGDYPGLTRYAKSNQMGPLVSVTYPAVVRRRYEYRRVRLTKYF